MIEWCDARPERRLTLATEIATMIKFRGGRLTIHLVTSLALTLSCSAMCHATSDSLVPVIVPVENIHSEGYCARETVAWDAINSPSTALSIIGEVLSRPQRIFVMGYGQSESTDINPITADGPSITVAVQGDESGTWSTSTVGISIQSVGKLTAEVRNKVITRAKLALVFALRNVFAWNSCAKVFATISGLPEEQDPNKVRLYPRTQFPYSARSPHYLALLRELSSPERCFVGRALNEPLPRFRADGRACP